MTSPSNNSTLMDSLHPNHLPRPPSIAVSDLSFRYGRGPLILSQVSFTIQPGEAVVVLGENGSGKSTLFLCLLQLIDNFTGTIEIAGFPLDNAHVETIRKKVGFLFQNSNDQLFLPEVREEIAFGPYNLGLRDGELETRVQHTLTDLDLVPYEHRSILHLSHGEKKRIAFATIYAMHPDIYLLDEPFVSLDPANRHLFMSKVTEEHKKGKTIVLVSHEIEQIPAFFKRAIVLNHGQIIFDGPLADLYQSPQILTQANLNTPILVQVFQTLQKEGLLPEDIPLPRNPQEALNILRPFFKKK